MKLEKIKSSLIEKASPERIDIIAAKSFLLGEKPDGGDTWSLSKEWAIRVAGPIPATLSYGTAEDEATVENFARYYKAQVALLQAVWELISVCLFIPGPVIREDEFSQSCSDGISSNHIELKEIGIPFPGRVIRPKAPPKTILSDGDLYLDALPSSDFHPGIKEALRLAVSCFRHEFFTPAVAMLAAASEGEWIELGRAFAEKHPSMKGVKRFEKNDLSIAARIDKVAAFYKDVEGEYRDLSRISHAHILRISIWSHVVREARNALHWNADSGAKNTYESVGVLLMSALEYLADLERLRNAVRNRTT